MLILIIVSVLISNASAKLFVSNEFDEDNDIVPSNVEPMNMQFKFIDRGNPLWVLSLSGDDWMAPKLRLGNTAEMEDFYNYIGPMIKSRRRQPPVRAKKDDPEKPTTKQPPWSDTDIKRDYIKIINKFALSTSVAPDAYITVNTHDYDSNPSISLFIKGPYVAMIVRLGRYQWHYFISTSSTLPNWFFEKHDTRESPILIPEEVKHELFSSLVRYLYLLFGFPV